jgi:predicted nucleotidyltransferase component of viral defense system
MDRERLEKLIPVLADKHNFRQEILEKDYYLTILLNEIRTGLSENLVFKGGTLLHKIYLNYSRLSEDLDFTYFSKEDLSTRSKRSKAITSIREKMKDFIESCGLKSNKPEGEGFNNSLQYIFEILYSSFVTGSEESIKVEVGLRNKPIDNPVLNTIKHFYKDPFTNEALVPENKALSLSFIEAVSEKLKAAITRRDLAIRDFYDLWYIAEANFNFADKKFLSIFKKKLSYEEYSGDYSYNLGLDKESIKKLENQIDTNLIPVIRIGEGFDLDNVFKRFNKIFGSAE